MPDESIEDIAERLERAADRFVSSGIDYGAEAARETARRVRAAGTPEEALALEREFMLGHIHAADPAAPARSWWWRLFHPGSWGGGGNFTDNS
jgi:hypothetical protein